MPACNCSVTSCTARRDGRSAPAAGAGGSRGAPTTIVTFTGLIILEPLGMARSEPPMPTGRIGTCVRAATNAAPSKSGCTTGPDWRVPSGKRTSGSPSRITSMQRRSASRSAEPRFTGKAPSQLSSRPNVRFLQSESLPM